MSNYYDKCDKCGSEFNQSKVEGRLDKYTCDKCIKIKRYMIFTYDRYYPMGGLDDCISFDELEEIPEFFKEIELDFYQFFDRHTGEFIRGKEHILDMIREKE
jgi:hypothetical protein